jgi:hypothetical protein
LALLRSFRGFWSSTNLLPPGWRTLEPDDPSRQPAAPRCGSIDAAVGSDPMTGAPGR